jgi:hypothetical protein
MMRTNTHKIKGQSIHSRPAEDRTPGALGEIEAWRARRANDFSLATLLEAGTGLGIVYGLLRNAPAIWIGNGVTLTLAGLHRLGENEKRFLLQ